MSKAKQLTLTVDPPTISPFPERLRDPMYKGYAWSAKDRPAEVARDVLAHYTRQRGTPREIQCHASMVEIVEKEAGGVPVLGIGRAMRVLLLGPVEN